MTDLIIRLLGQFPVSLDGEAVSSFASDKLRALLAYLVSESYPYTAGSPWYTCCGRILQNLPHALACDGL